MSKKISNFSNLVNEQPFVVIEMDEPQRKYVTSMSQGNNPNWNENFDL